MRLPKISRDTLLPSYEDLHESTHADKTDIVVGARSVELPMFNSGVLDEKMSVKYKAIKDGDQTVGRRFHHDMNFRHGIDHAARVYIPTDEHRSAANYSLLMNTPWCTGLSGHNDAVAEEYMRSLGVPVVLFGPEFTASDPSAVGAATKLSKVALLASEISLAKAGETASYGYEFLREVAPEYGLTQNVVVVGESRGGMIGQIQPAYLRERGLSPLYSDLTDPSVSERASMSVEGAIRVGKWPIVEALGVTAVGAGLLKNGNLHRQIGTIPLSLRYQIGALGTGRAILSGEEGSFHQYVPLDQPQHIMNCSGNSMADTDIRKENYSQHWNTHIREINTCHLGLAYPSVQAHVIRRIRAADERNKQSGFIDIQQIAGQKNAALEAA